MQIDPHAWIVVFPLALGLVQVRGLPEEHRFKRLWADARQADALVMSRLRGRPVGASPGAVDVIGFWVAVAALVLSGLASVAAYAGLV